MTTYEIYSVIHELGRKEAYIPFYDVANALVARGMSFADSVDYLKSMLQDGYLVGAFESPVRLSPKGLTRLQDLQESANKDAENKRNYRFQNKLSILCCLIPLLTFIVSLVIDYWDSILAFFSRLFH